MTDPLAGGHGARRYSVRSQSSAKWDAGRRHSTLPTGLGLIAFFDSLMRAVNKIGSLNYLLKVDTVCVCVDTCPSVQDELLLARGEARSARMAFAQLQFVPTLAPPSRSTQSNLQI